MRSAHERRAARWPFWRGIGAALALTVLAGCVPTPAEQARLPHTYLQQALHAVDAHNAPVALAAIDKAGRAWVAGNTPYGNAQIMVDPEALREIARARQSVQMGLWSDAHYYISAAMTHPSTINPD